MSVGQYIALCLAGLLVVWQFRGQLRPLLKLAKRGSDTKWHPSSDRLAALTALETARKHAEVLGNDLAITRIDETCKAFFEVCTDAEG